MKFNISLCYRAAILAILLANSCHPNEIEDNEPVGNHNVFHAAVEDMSAFSRTTLAGGPVVCWKPFEEISIFGIPASNGGQKFISQNSEPVSTTEFRGIKPQTGDSKQYWAFSPYQENNSFDGSALFFDLSDKQVAVAGDFPDTGFPSLSVSQSNELNFYNICGGLCLTFTRSDIKSVSFEVDDDVALSGSAVVQPGDNGIPVITGFPNVKKCVTLFAPENGCFEPGVDYYMVLFPGKINGFTLKFYGDELLGSFNSSKSNEIKRSVFAKLTGMDQRMEEEIKIPGVIDLGLPSGVLWATCNLGASSPEESGDFYAWGETETKTNYSWSTYKWSKGSEKSLTKYNTNSSYGSVDRRTSLDADDDVARYISGGYWRMPTGEEVDELFANCTWTLTQMNGVWGYKVSGSKSGYTDKSIFLPMAGAYRGTSIVEKGRTGIYWSSSTVATPSNARSFYFFYSGSRYSASGSDMRCYGSSIRPVLLSPDVAIEVTLNKSSLSLIIGKREKLLASVSPGGVPHNLIWFSDNEAVATVDQDGMVTAVSEGEAIIKVETDDGKFSASCIVTVEAFVHVTGVSLNTTSMRLSESYYGQLQATVTPENASDKKLQWASSDTRVVSVDNYGRLEGINAGKAKVTVTTVDGGYSASCEVTVIDVFKVLKIVLSKNSLSLYSGRTYQLKATVYPTEAENKYVRWSSSNSKVATVSGGFVSALKPGVATIIAASDDGSGARSECTVTVMDFPEPEAVDLGLSVLWSSFNLGATKPEEYGAYYAWGETDVKDVYSTDTYKWSGGYANAGNPWLVTKYCPSGTPYWAGEASRADDKMWLDAEDDAARVKLGGTWRMPTKNHWQELMDNCSFTQETRNGVSGILVTSKVEGYTDSSIFIPYSGAKYNSDVKDSGKKFYILTNELYQENFIYIKYYQSFAFIGQYVNTINIDYNLGGAARYYGHTVRPVRSK